MLKSASCLLLTGLLLALTACSGLDSDRDASRSGAVASYYLPKTFVKVTLSKKDNALELEAEPMAAPDGAPLFLTYDNSILSDDQLCVARSPSGMLQSVVLASTDRTIDIIVNIAELVARFARPPATRAAASTRALGKVSDGVIVSFWVDTQWSPNALAAKEAEVAAMLENAGLAGYTIDVRGLAMPATAPIAGSPAPKAGSPAPKAGSPAPKAQNRSRRGHVYFRSTVKRPVVLKRYSPSTANVPEAQRAATGSSVPVAIKFVDVIDPRSTSHVNVSRAFGVEKVTEIHLKDGALIGVRIRKPSEALALSELPLKVIDRILTVPANFFARAFGPSADREKLIQEQAALIEQFKALQAQRIAQRTPTQTFVTVNNQEAPPANTAEQITCTPKKK